MVKIEEKKVESVIDFFNQLSPLNLLHTESDDPEYFFRGQGNADWPLLPSIYRDSTIKDFAKKPNSSEATVNEIKYLEKDILRCFWNSCDEQGLALPGKPESIQNLLSSNGPATWWQDLDIKRLMALAQHHGLPTRLLDWTKRPYVAAYFAAFQALSSQEKDSRIVVWVLNIKKLKTINDATIEIVNVPGATSINLAAQAGCFTSFNLPGETKISDISLGRLPTLFLEGILKVTLPVTEVSQVLYYCARFGITSSILFPGFNGAAEAALVEMKMC